MVVYVQNSKEKKLYRVLYARISDGDRLDDGYNKNLLIDREPPLTLLVEGFEEGDYKSSLIKEDLEEDFSNYLLDNFEEEIKVKNER